MAKQPNKTSYTTNHRSINNSNGSNENRYDQEITTRFKPSHLNSGHGNCSGEGALSPQLLSRRHHSKQSQQNQASFQFAKIFPMSQPNVKPFLKRSLKTPLMQAKQDAPRHLLPIKVGDQNAQLGRHFIVDKSRERKSELEQFNHNSNQHDRQNKNSLQPVVSQGQSQSHSMLHQQQKDIQSSPQTRTFNQLGYQCGGSIQKTDESLSDLQQRRTLTMFSERLSKGLKSTSMEKPGQVKQASMHTTATSINYGSIKQSAFVGGLPKSLQKTTNNNFYMLGKTNNNFNRLNTADQSGRNENVQVQSKPNALMSFLADILGEPTETKPINKLPRQNIDLNSKAPVIRQLPNHYYKGIIQSTTKRKNKGMNSKVGNKNNNQLLCNYSKRPVSPEDEVDQLMTARRRTVQPRPLNQHQQVMGGLQYGQSQSLYAGEVLLDGGSPSYQTGAYLTNRSNTTCQIHHNNTQSRKNQQDQLMKQVRENVVAEEAGEDLEERFQKECEDLMGSLSETDEQAGNFPDRMYQQVSADENDTVYDNSASRELITGAMQTMNLDLAEVRGEFAGGNSANYNVAMVNNMNATWNQRQPLHMHQNQLHLKELSQQGKNAYYNSSIGTGTSSSPTNNTKMHGYNASPHNRNTKLIKGVGTNQNSESNTVVSRFLMSNKPLQLVPKLKQNQLVKLPIPVAVVIPKQKSIDNSRRESTGTSPGVFNISVTSFSKAQLQQQHAPSGIASPTIVANPLSARITPTTSTQLLSLYQQHHQLSKKQD